MSNKPGRKKGVKVTGTGGVDWATEAHYQVRVMVPVEMIVEYWGEVDADGDRKVVVLGGGPAPGIMAAASRVAADKLEPEYQIATELGECLGRSLTAVSEDVLGYGENADETRTFLGQCGVLLGEAVKNWKDAGSPTGGRLEIAGGAAGPALGVPGPVVPNPGVSGIRLVGLDGQPLI